MVYKRLRELLLFIVLIQIAGCKEPYDPSLEAGLKDYLIVEGFINTSGVTSIQLSRSMKLADAGLIKPENGAILQIEGDDNTSYPLTFKEKGLYQSAELNLAHGNKYRLRIRTAGGTEYLSDYTDVRSSPGLEVTWDQQADGIRVYASAEDPTGQTKYYQWAYEETWEVRSFKPSIYRVSQAFPTLIIGARSAESVGELLFCWASSVSSNILTVSTAALGEDKVDRYPLVFIPNGSDKPATRYSILVKQYAISREAYEFLELMKKNSEQMGSVFDPQPSTIRGNIINVADPNEPVIGFMVAAAPVEKRIFITSAEAGDWKSNLLCPETYVLNTKDSVEKYFRHRIPGQDLYLITDGLDDPESQVPRMLGYFASLPVCLDCRMRGGGSNVKPSFW